MLTSGVLLCSRGASSAPPPGKGGGGGDGGGLTNPAFAYIERGDLHVMTADGSVRQKLTKGGNEKLVPVWSADGADIAFLEIHDGHGNELSSADLMAVRPDGSGLTLLHTFHSSFPATDLRLEWLPDGTRFIYRGQADLWVLDLLTGEEYSLDLLSSEFDVVFGASLTPDLDPNTPDYQGMMAVAARAVGDADLDIWIVDVFTNDVGGIDWDAATLTSLPEEGHQWSPVWSPHTLQIAYRDGGFSSLAALRAVDVDVVNRQFGPSKLVIDAPVHRKVTWSPGSDWIGFAAETSAGLDLFVIRPDGTGLTDITADNSDQMHPHWNPAWIAP
jgi:Tol biopolymer transport system component